MAKKTKEAAGMGIHLADDTTAPEAIAAEPAPARQDKRPTCPIHGAQMTAYTSSDMYTYYKCPVGKCRERGKKVRPVGPFKDLYGNGASARKE